MTKSQTTRGADGLDSLTDDALMNELAARGLNSLLERAFEINKVPESERQGRRTLIALSKLSDPSARLNNAQRQKLVGDIVKGIEQALPSINDPKLLMRQAFVLITQSVERDVSTLEYWGENPRTQASLRPTVQAVIRILDRCNERAKVLAEELANKITSPNSPFVARYEEMDRLAATAEYSKNMVMYYLALSIDPASPDRKKIATDAAEYLKQFDVPENPDRCMVRNRTAKLAMVRGDLDAARKLFAAVINDTGEPRPTVPQQYEARYFSAVIELIAKNVAAAKKGRDELKAWQATNLPNDKTSRDGAEAAAYMLDYRIAGLEADLISDPAAKSAANDKAVAILMELLGKRADLRPVIYEQLLPKLEDRTDLKTTEPLMLRALISRGEQEVQRGKDEQVDRKALERAVDAAREVARRAAANPGQIDSEMLDASALLVPFFLQRLSSKPDAANAFLDYVEQYKVRNPRNAALALDNAQALIGELRATAETREDSAVIRAYERFLPLAIGEPFNRRDFAFEYARRLQLNGKPRQAVAYYRMMPADDKRVGQARYLELVALKQQIDDEPAGAPDRAQALAQIQKLADEVNAAASRSGDRATLVRTSLLAADLARREQKDPQRALQLLNGFEASVKGLPNADKLVNEAMYVRVQAYMSAEKYNEATQELVGLLNKSEGAQGAQIVYDLLEKLNADFDRAQEAGDRGAMKTLAKNRAKLSGFLVDWAAGNKDPGIKKYTYRYRVFDAETQRRAADLEDDAAARQAGMKLSLQRYQALESPENVALYKASLDPQAGAADPNLFDPQVTFGIALIQYDLGNYSEAAARFSKLLTTRKLGTAVITVEESGQQRVIDNEQYWEAILKLIRCNQKLGTGIEEARSYLKLQYITWGQRVGGRKWKAQYEALRAELIPDFKVEEASTRPAG